jgi:hypothetical protein
VLFEYALKYRRDDSEDGSIQRLWFISETGRDEPKLDSATLRVSLDILGAMDGVTVQDQMEPAFPRNPAAGVLGQPTKVVPKRLDCAPSRPSFVKCSGVDLNHWAPTSGALPDLLACVAWLPRVCSRGPNESVSRANRRERSDRVHLSADKIDWASQDA